MLVGWSNGGGTVLFTAARDPSPLAGLFARFVAFYPGCRTALNSDWAPSGPLMILVGANDDWTPAPPCEALAKKFPDPYHASGLSERLARFLDGRMIQWRSGDRAGDARPAAPAWRAGTNPVARADALTRVPAFVDGG